MDARYPRPDAVRLHDRGYWSIFEISSYLACSSITDQDELEGGGGCCSFSHGGCCLVVDRGLRGLLLRLKDITETVGLSEISRGGCDQALRLCWIVGERRQK